MIELRDATDDDGEALLLVLGAAFAEYPPCLMERGEYPELARPRESFARQGGALWVVEDEHGVVGSCGVTPSREPDLCELKKLYLLPRARRRGVASQLVALAERFAESGGRARVHLFSDARFVDAHRRYERLGYRRLDDVRALGDVSQSIELHFEKRLG
ncbi:MAG: GNAT family N-acetyltransferase [Polyangiaceae bacterium]|nr:GNAT family N-acetyltransferase [Polyangiaceae bacterium]